MAVVGHLLPTVHVVQLPCAVLPLNEPAAQSVHETAPAAEYVPVPQSVPSVVRAVPGHIFPEVHALHDARPVTSAYVPAEQSGPTVVRPTPGHRLPVGHAVQAVWPVLPWYSPALHGVTAAMAVVGHFAPMVHVLQTVCPVVS